MDINKIINNSIEKEKKKIIIDENLFDKNWLVIHKKINASGRKKHEKRRIYLKEITAVAVFIGILILIPSITQHYKSKNGKLPDDNAATINNNIDTYRSKQIKVEDYDKTLGTVYVNGDYKEQKRVEALVTQVAKKQFDNFLVSYVGMVEAGKYHEIRIHEITKAKIPSVMEYYVKANTDEVYIEGRNSNKKAFIKITDGAKVENNRGFIEPDDIEKEITLLIGKNIKLHRSDLSDYKDIIDIKKYNIIYEDDKKENVYAVNIENGDIYKLNKNNGKLELVYKNKINNDKVTRKLREDVNGDGKEDVIKLDCYNSALTVNDVTIATNSYCLTGNISIVDIKKIDSLKEIAIEEAAPSACYYMSYYYFNGDTFVSYHRIPGHNILVDGSGRLLAKEVRGRILQTWYHDEEYKLTDNFGVEGIPKEMYPLQQKLKVKHTLQLQKSKTDKGIVATLKEGEEVMLIGCDDKGWCCIKGSSGTIGWFEVEELNIIKSIKLRAEEVFDGLQIGS